MKNIMVILNYNDYKTTNSYINTIKDYKSLNYIIVVDNNSKDDSYEKLKKLENNKIIILKSDKNGGYGYGNNIGIKYAVKKYGKCNVIISNPDIEVSDDTIKNMSKYLNDNSNVAIVSPVINENGNLNRGWKLTNGFKEMLISIPLIGTKIKSKIIGYSKKYYNTKQTKVDVMSGCFFMIKSDIFKKINYFDENLFLYYEENIICKKIKDLNYDIMVLNDHNVVHKHSVSIDKNNNELNKYKILKQSQKYYLDNYAKCSLLSKMLMNIFEKIMIIKYKMHSKKIILLF